MRSLFPLSDWQQRTLKAMLYEYQRSVKRKRSWGMSSKAMAMAEAQILVEKIIEHGKEHDAATQGD
jgi:hypothetical protein